MLSGVPYIASLLTDFGTVLLGILFVALPFVALGVFVSQLIQQFIPRQRLLALYGKNFWRNYLVSVGTGFLFPVCECGIVPIARGLAEQGVPTSAIVMFLLSAPILNPITIGATVAAFPTTPHVWIWRILISQIMTITIGWVFQAFTDTQGRPLSILKKNPATACCETEPGSSRIDRFFGSSWREFAQVFPYIILGASITSLLQLSIPKQLFYSLSLQPLLTIPLFMGFALVLSVCSSVDAFVILPFSSRIPFAALLTFLNFGPLVDIKNILLFRAYFSPTFRRWYLGLMTVSLAVIVYTLWFVYPGDLHL